MTDETTSSREAKMLESIERDITNMNGPGIVQPPKPENNIDKSIAEAIADRHVLLDRVNKAEAQSAQWAEHSSVRERVLASLEEQLKKSNDDRDFYLRGLTELTTLVTAARDMLSKLIPAAEARARGETKGAE